MSPPPPLPPIPMYRYIHYKVIKYLPYSQFSFVCICSPLLAEAAAAAASVESAVLAQDLHPQDTSNDLLLAQMLQAQFNQEHDKALQIGEDKFNGQSKGGTLLRSKVKRSSLKETIGFPELTDCSQFSLVPVFQHLVRMYMLGVGVRLKVERNLCAWKLLCVCVCVCVCLLACQGFFCFHNASLLLYDSQVTSYVILIIQIQYLCSFPSGVIVSSCLLQCECRLSRTSEPIPQRQRIMTGWIVRKKIIQMKDSTSEVCTHCTCMDIHSENISSCYLCKSSFVLCFFIQRTCKVLIDVCNI